MELIPSVSVLALRPIADHLAALGVPRSLYASRLGLCEDLLLDDDARVPIYKLLFMWEHAVALANDLDLGLHLAEGADEQTFGAISALALASPTIGDAFRRVERYARFVAGSKVYDIIIDGDVAALRAVRARWFPMDRQAIELLLGTPHVYSTRASVWPWRPIEVTFAHERPATSSSAVHARLFDCPVRFGARFDEIRFSAHLLESPSRFRNDALADTLQRVSQSLLDHLRPESDLVARVVVHTWDRLQLGDTSLEHVAQSLGMSERSLQRRLADERTSHREILDKVRATFAEHLLSSGSHRLIEIAMMLGFAEQTAFQKAFRRWTGTSPARWRRHAA